LFCHKYYISREEIQFIRANKESFSSNFSIQKFYYIYISKKATNGTHLPEEQGTAAGVAVL
jgi:hypothetical protein